jgi:hypothetical protein
MDISRVRGDTYADAFAISDASLGGPVDITGSTFKLTLDTLQSPVGVLTQIYQLTGTITNAPLGKVEFAPTALQAARTGYYFYVIQMTDGQGRIRTLSVGAYQYS